MEDASQSEEEQHTATELQQKIAQMEREFGEGRAKLKKMYMQKEEEVRLLAIELEESNSRVVIAECTAENRVEAEQRKCREELATLQQLCKEETETALLEVQERYESQLRQVKKQIVKIDLERKKYRQLYYQTKEAAEQQQQQPPSATQSSLLSPGLLTGLTKSIIAKHVPGLNNTAATHSSSNHLLATPSDTTSNASSSSATSSCATASDNTTETTNSASSSEATVGFVAGVDNPSFVETSNSNTPPAPGTVADLLRQDQQSVAAVSDLTAMDQQQQTNVAEVLKKSCGGCSNDGCSTLIAALQEELQLLRTALHNNATTTTTPTTDTDEREQSSLAAEKSSRADLELYSSLLSQQRTALADQLIQQKQHTNNYKKLYDCERHALNELRGTWQRANDQFLTSQRHSLTLTQRLTGILSNEQLQRLQADTDTIGGESSDSEDYAPIGTSIKSSGTSPPQLQLQYDDDDDSDENILEECILPDKNQSGSGLSTVGGATSLDLTCSSALSSPTPPPHSAETSQTPRKHSADLLSIESDLSGSLALSARFSPDHLPALSEEQKKALELVTTGSSSLEQDTTAAPDVVLGGVGRMVVSEAGWRRLQKDLKQTKADLAKPCKGCRVQVSHVREARAEMETLKSAGAVQEAAIGRQRQQLEREATYRQEMEDKWVQLVEQYQQTELVWGKKLQDAAGLHKQLLTRWKDVVEDLQQKMAALARDREDTQKHLNRVEYENHRLAGKHLSSARALQEEAIDLPNTTDELQLLVLTLKEDCITANVAKETAEEGLAGSVTRLVEASGENRQLRDMVTSLQQTASQDQQSEELQHHNKQQLALIMDQLQQTNKIKAQLEQDMLEQKRRVTGLQHDLDLSEQTQRDFVRLSQSLQVQLEKIRQSDSEVRWQHEDDVDECNNCKHRFSSIKRKHHCRHCGRVFCSDCVAKNVVAGPHRRQFRVCDVCHTLLVPHATPYFSATN